MKKKIVITVDERRFARLKKLAAAEGKTASDKLTELVQTAARAFKDEK